MAPLPPSNTKRYFLDYQVTGIPHTLQMRCASSVNAADARNGFNNFLAAITSAIYEITVVGMRVAEQGSNVTNPVAISPAIPLYGSGAQPQGDRPNFIGWVGRSSGGRRARVFLFGYSGFDPPDYRLQPGESGSADAVVAILNATPLLWWAVDGLKPVYKTYTNYGYNAFWQRKNRG